MNPQNQNGYRGFLMREQKRKEALHKIAMEWQPEVFKEDEMAHDPKTRKFVKNEPVVVKEKVVETTIVENTQPTNPPKEGKMKTFWTVVIAIGTIILIVLCYLLGMAAYLQVRNDYAPKAVPITIVVPTQAPVIAPTKAPVVQPTKAPVVATEAPKVASTEAPIVAPVPTEAAPTKAPVVIATKTPIVVILPTNPSLEGKLGTVTQQGEDLDTILGKRITFTCRKIVVPTKAWNEVLSPEELKSVETTWVDFTISVPEGTFARIFAGGIRQGTNTYNEGVLMNLKPGTYEFSLRNGEIVLWYPEQDKFEQNDLVRIFDQIRNGNFDIHSKLAFFATTTDLLPKIPADLVQKNNVQIVPSLDPTIM